MTIDQHHVANENGPEPRLLTAAQASRYLGFKAASALKGFPFKPIYLAMNGMGRAMYDRKAIDEWLDDRSGLEGPRISREPANDVDAEFEVWRQGREARSR